MKMPLPTKKFNERFGGKQELDFFPRRATNAITLSVLAARFVTVRLGEFRAADKADIISRFDAPIRCCTQHLFGSISHLGIALQKAFLVHLSGILIAG